MGITSTSLYDDFSKSVITDQNGNSSINGWIDGKIDGKAEYPPTPLNAANLNKMLNMLVQIRDVIGKTDSFQRTIVNTNDLGNSIPSPNGSENNSIASYIENVAAALLGKDDDANENTIYGIKKAVANVVENLSENAISNTWAQSITQTNGKISVEYTQPDASDISVNGLELKSYFIDADFNTKSTDVAENLKDSLSYESLSRYYSDYWITQRIDSIDEQISDIIGTSTDISLSTLNTAIGEINNTIENLEFTTATSSLAITGITQTSGKISEVSTTYGKDLYYDNDSTFEDKLDALTIAGLNIQNGEGNDSLVTKVDKPGNDNHKPNTSTGERSFVGGCNSHIFEGGEHFLFGHGLVANNSWNKAIFGTWNADKCTYNNTARSFKFEVGGGVRYNNNIYRGDVFAVSANGDFLITDYKEYNEFVNNPESNKFYLYSLTGILKKLLNSDSLPSDCKVAEFPITENT